MANDLTPTTTTATTKSVDLATDHKSVLVIGRSQVVLDQAVARLGELGYKAEATNDVSAITGRFDPKQIDVVVFGGQVPPDRKAALAEEISASNPKVILVQGLAGIPGLIADQVQQALGGEHLIPGQAPTFDATRRAIALVLFAPLDVAVTAYWVTASIPPDPKSDSQVLFDDRLPAGEHTFALPDHANLDAAFATVRAGDARWSFRLT
jgi:hypothetical protein